MSWHAHQERKEYRAPARWSVAIIFLPLLGAGVARAGQQKATPAEAPPTLRVSTEVVNVVAVVKDKKGHLVPDLTGKDFGIWEDGKPQELRYFSRETDTPLTLGLLVDTSASQGRVLSVEQQQAKAFLRQVLRPKDLAFVIRFDLDVELLQDFTDDVARLNRAIDETEINAGGGGVLPGPFPGQAVGGTHLYDAVYLAANELMKNQIGRKVLILLTDGQDQGSRETLGRALEAAQKSDLIIYSLAVIDRAFYNQHWAGDFNGESVLQKLSEQTGGRVIRASGNRDLALAFQQLVEELRTEYLLGYTPSNTRLDGSFRRITVRINDGNYKVQARRGYYAQCE